MKSKFLSLALALSALCSAVKVEAKQTTILIQQTIATNTSTETPSFFKLSKKRRTDGIRKWGTGQSKAN
jgi:hypothetical protein